MHKRSPRWERFFNTCPGCSLPHNSIDSIVRVLKRVIVKGGKCMFNFFRKKTEVLNHWVAFVDGFQMSPLEFYDQIQKELKVREVPEMEMNRIDFPEGGLLSEKRVYLRMLRERIVFDVCAAPFGKNFFFSCRTSEIPLRLSMVQVVGVFLLFCFLLFGLMYIMGTLKGILTTAAVFFLSLYVMKSALGDGLKSLDRTLSQSPLVGSIYMVLFRKETYFRIDSRLCYIEAVPTIVKQLAEDATGAKGIRLVRQYEIAPVLGDLYKRCPISSPDGMPSVANKNSHDPNELLSMLGQVPPSTSQ